MCKAGMANADPIIVCGRVNLHKTIGKGGLLDASSSSLSLAGAVAVEDVWSNDGSLFALLWSSNLRLAIGRFAMGDDLRSEIVDVDVCWNPNTSVS
jgi:hypothetical protein